MSGTDTRILLVDDHALLRRGASLLFDATPGLVVVAQASTAAEALAALEEHDVDLAVVDLGLPDADGLELIKQVAARWPELKMLVLSMHAERAYAERALRAGARGYVMKSDDPTTLLEAVKQVAAGGVHLSEAMQQVFVRRVAGGDRASDAGAISRLTDRELTVFRMLGEGCDLRQISTHLKISLKTAQNYRERLKSKLDVDSARALVREATLYVERHHEDV